MEKANIKDRLTNWRALANAAEEAERHLARAGQGAASPEYRDLALRARQLRGQADREFAAITRAISRSNFSDEPDQRREGPAGDGGRERD